MQTTWKNNRIMILVFGGTTEGRKAAEVLEEAGSAYFYSTKTGEQDITLHHGQRIDGALDAEAMRCFCTEHKIRLIVDAAHPFAQQLHQTIIQVSETLNIPIIRYERIYPPRDGASSGLSRLRRSHRHRSIRSSASVLFRCIGIRKWCTEAPAHRQQQDRCNGQISPSREKFHRKE